jgi:hypothetical protein
MNRSTVSGSSTTSQSSRIPWERHHAEIRVRTRMIAPADDSPAGSRRTTAGTTKSRSEFRQRWLDTERGS